MAPNSATTHYGCAKGCDRQYRQQVAISDPVGWIWVLKLMKGGVRGASWSGFSGNLSASTVMLKQQLYWLKRKKKMLWTVFLPHRLAADARDCCCCTSVSVKCGGCCQSSRVRVAVWVIAEDQDVIVWCPLVATVEEELPYKHTNTPNDI